MSFQRSLFPYQLDGVNFLLEHSGALLADEMGLGKGIQAIGVINALLELQRILIICPATMRLVWREELCRWLIRPLRVVVAGIDPLDEQILAHVHILIINYDRLAKVRGLLVGESWDLCILDECHLIKNPETARSQIVSQIKALRRLALSGTPIPNRPIELYSVLTWLDPIRWPISSRFKFASRYCAARYTSFGWDYSGASNTGELGRTLRESIMLRRTKAQVLPELPPKLRSVVELTYDVDLRKLVRAELAAFRSWEKTSERKVEPIIGKRVSLPEGISAALSWDRLAKARAALALAKVPLVAEFVRETLSVNDGKVVIFAHHRAMIVGLAEALNVYSPVILYGGMSAKQKQSSIDTFKDDANCRIFIGNIQAAGLGITLAPASSHCIFAELSWVPSELSQCEDRLHRV